MSKNNRREEFLDVTMKIVAEKGLDGFSVKQVTDAMNVSEALIYKYFSTKNLLLLSCYQEMHRSIGGIFKGMIPSLSDIESDPIGYVRSLWFKYFRFLLDNGYRTIFYFDYRDSTYMRDWGESDDNNAKLIYFSDFGHIIYAIDNRYGFLKRVSYDHLWTFVLDTTGVFAKRIIRGELPDSEESLESTWKLISGGIAGVLDCEHQMQSGEKK